MKQFWPVSLNGRNLISPHGPTFFQSLAQNLNAPLAQLMRYVSVYYVTERCQPLDPIVDLYNAVSLRYAVSGWWREYLGLSGVAASGCGKGTEPFDTVKEGETAVEYPSQGEVIWCDDIGVTCRRWNWRQGIRTRLGVEAQQMWFILESLPQMPLETLHEAGKMLTDGLEKMMPGLWFELALIEEQHQ
nr:B3/4 domain-containing protein [Raoultella sp. NCTC 9187]